MTVSEDKEIKSKISKTLHDAFGWALTKDRALFERIFSNDDDFLSYFPDSKGTAIAITKIIFYY